MWSSHHIGDSDGAGNPENGNSASGAAASANVSQASDPAQLAAISALAAFSQQAAEQAARQAAAYPQSASIGSNPFGYVDAGTAAMAAAAAAYPYHQTQPYRHYHTPYAPPGDLAGYGAATGISSHGLGQGQHHSDDLDLSAVGVQQEDHIAPASDGESSEDSDEEMPDVNGAELHVPVEEPPVPRGKPEAMAVALAAAQREAAEKELKELEAEDPIPEAVAEAVAEPVDEGAALTPAALPKPKKPRRSPAKKKTQAAALPALRTELLLGEKTAPISEEEWANLKTLMQQFCKVPLLAEFSRPVALLHPELLTVYSKIVSHPVDLGLVSRGIRRKLYKSTRDVRLDMWRVFANCVKFHSHPNNKEAVPSFVSIALHLRNYFNNLWHEYMMPSDLPSDPSETQKQAFILRDTERQKRHRNSGVLNLNSLFTQNFATLLEKVVDNGGCVDILDKEPVFGPDAPIQHPDLDAIESNLRQCISKMAAVTDSDEYTVGEFYDDLRKCYTEDALLEDDMALRNQVANRMDRFFAKISIPLHEANTRGVTQSSIWGNIATTIWARESSKKPYWPALCLGILPPEEQREAWHAAVTECNEARLPEKLRTQLMAAKKNCEKAQKRVSLSYFLVEFCGTHEFIWVRETDIIEKFDPGSDPNKIPGLSSSRKKRASRSVTANVVSSKMYSTAMEECCWANEEFEVVLAEAFNGRDDDLDADGEEVNYSYSLLSQSDDEADTAVDRGYEFRKDRMSESDIEEANWLLSHEGVADLAVGKKKKATPAKKKVVKEKKETKKSKDNKKKKDSRAREREVKREQRDLDKRRKRRQRERDRIIRGDKKKRKQDDDEDVGKLSRDKRLRASAIARAYVNRATGKDYKSLGLAGVTTLPASMVESTGLLGTALAIRAASGELDMPDTVEEGENQTKPWLAIDTDEPKAAKERVERIQRQLEALQKHIDATRVHTQRRIELTSTTVTERSDFVARIEADEKAVRQTYLKKRTSPKKSAPAKESKPDPVVTDPEIATNASETELADETTSNTNAESLPAVENTDAIQDPEEQNDCDMSDDQEE